MTEEYDEATARHYAAYRPPLHDRILRPVLGRGTRFLRGLDVGCGTGHSTIALSKYGASTVGVDPAQRMIRAAEPLRTPAVDFVVGNAVGLAERFCGEQFDLFTFAGSLAYLDPAQTLQQIQELAQRGTRVVTYDFDVQLQDIYRRLGYDAPASGYRHDAELPESKAYGFKRCLRIRQRPAFVATSVELAHLLLSVKGFRLWAAQRFGDELTHVHLTTTLGKEGHRLTAKTYCSLFAFQG